MEFKQVLTQAQIFELTGGMTESVFPRTEKKLLSATDYQEALQFIGSRKDMDRYRSMIDFLHCEIFTEWQRYCFQYYNDEAPRLAKTPGVTIEYLKAADIFMSELVLELALTRLNEKRRASWSKFRKEVMSYLMAA